MILWSRRCDGFGVGREGARGGYNQLTQPRMCVTGLAGLACMWLNYAWQSVLLVLALYIAKREGRGWGGGLSWRARDADTAHMYTAMALI